MQIRLARTTDLKSCGELDSSYETDYVWQVQTHVETERIETLIQRTRLPRSVTVHLYPDPRQMRQHWNRHECFLVAEHQGHVLGFVDMALQEPQRAGWINGFVVDRRYRRRGIGRALLKSARAWAEQRDLRVIMLETQPKNHPAIHFYLQQGFYFCGYNDQYYNDEDIALFFACRLR